MIFATPAQIDATVGRDKLPDRAAVPLFNAALGWRITNAFYRRDAEVSEFVASRDLKRLCHAGLLHPHGERRGRIYRATDTLRALRLLSRTPGPLLDPYALVAAGRQPRLDPDRG